ncbi:hypothetical protein CC78DRAFT_206512 [Lojkania enalia]|uniref:Uncharacterized protein n=1 Tax=Lojkania enalia TaxID=147567 RepID=A0A9P4MXL4_9PLEO|nr:hypothetical protein CC78DRAFT_206512 [Didymosphaeria enalia]
MELGMGRHQRPGIPCSGCMLCQQFCLQASSIILTTNLFGDFSKCCIISKHFYQSSASEPASLTLDSIGQDSRNIWLRFVHQPQTARCLAFYLILGQLCKEIAREYRHAMKAIDSVVKFDDIFNHKDGKRIDDEDVMPRFKIGLWALESLFRLQKSLRVTVASIRDARDELEAQINEGPGTRGEALEALCQHYVDTFESGFAALVWVDTKLDTDIALITRYKEGFNAVLTLNDSRESVKQNRTIQRLTYLTIGYLPMGLAAAIFAIPGEQHVVHEPMGRGWFIWCILILLVATSLAAFFIEGLLHSFRRVFLSIWRPLKTTINRLLRCLIAAWWLWTIYHKRRQYSKESLLSKKRHEVSQGV